MKLCLLTACLLLAACADAENPETAAPRARVDSGPLDTGRSPATGADTGASSEEDTAPTEDTGTDDTHTSDDTAPADAGLDCPTCITTQCEGERLGCSGDPPCTFRATCYGACAKGAGGSDCRAKCDTDHPSPAGDSYLGCVATRCTMCKF